MNIEKETKNEIIHRKSVNNNSNTNNNVSDINIQEVTKPIIIIDESKLSKHVTVLKRPVSDSVIYLVGTAHVSKASIEEVKEIMEYVKPEVVVVELCAARSGLLFADEQKLLESIAKDEKKKYFFTNS